MKRRNTNSPSLSGATPNEVGDRHRSYRRALLRNLAVPLGVAVLFAAMCGTFVTYGLGQSAGATAASSRLVIAAKEQSAQRVRTAGELSFSTFTPPVSIPDNCSTDVTSALNSWFASLPTFATVNLPYDACYLVSNSPSSDLIIQDTVVLTINGNGTTFKQNTYVDTYDNHADPQTPVLTIGSNFDLTINNVTLNGPTSNGGWNDEGNAGILMWQNWIVTLNGITITNVEGDGLDVYPLGNEPGVNWYVTLNHSTIDHVGYKAIVPEAADHFTIENSTLVSNDIDAEVDFSCQGDLPNCGTMADPSIGVENMIIEHDSFPTGLALEDEMSCMPVGNWTIDDNNFGTGGLLAQFDATYSLSLSALQACGRYSGLTIEGNTSTDSQPPCCGAGSPYVLLQGWTNVRIANNHLVFALNQGLVGGPVVVLWGDTNVAITNNAFVNFFNLAWSDAPSGWPATTGVTICGNTTGDARYPVVAAACSG
jgi:hypothetical protein